MLELKIKNGNPPENGMYVVYVDHRYVCAYPDKKLLMYVNGRWGYLNSDQNFRGKVHGWIGPLPMPSLKDLNSDIKYAIAILPDGLHGSFQDGPFDTLDEAEDTIGEKGQYIFELDLENDAEVIRKWSEKKQKWLKKAND